MKMRRKKLMIFLEFFSTFLKKSFETHWAEDKWSFHESDEFRTPDSPLETFGGSGVADELVLPPIWPGWFTVG